MRVKSSDITFGEAMDVFGREMKCDYWLAKYANGKARKILCSVEVMSVDPNGNIKVRIVGSDEFTVRKSSLKT